MSIAMVTLFDGESYQQLAELVNPGKQTYCDRFGYDFICFPESLDRSRPAAWSKILAIKKVLADYEWVIWSDVDTVLWDPTIELRQFVSTETRNLVIQENHEGLNSGVFLLRNCQWSHDFLNVVDAQKQLSEHPWWEQQAIIELREHPHWGDQYHVYPHREPARGFHGYFESGGWDNLLLHFAGIRGDRRHRLIENTVRLSALPQDTRMDFRKTDEVRSELSSLRADEHHEKLLAGYLATQSSYPRGYQGRGIVVPGGGGRFAACTWVCVNRIRQLGCRLPIQVWYLGAEERDDLLARELAALDVVMVDAHAVRQQQPHLHLQGWELKAYALLHCPFEEVLLLDADNAPVRDPTYLFESCEYRDTGALFWPDYWRMTPDRSFWRVMGIPYVDEPEFESGQMVVDKRRCWQAVELANWLCERGAAYFWNHCHGDKDCFRAAWRRTRTPFSMPRQGVTTLSDLVMIQYGFDGERLFQHRNLAKWSMGTNPRIADFWNEESCFALIANYRRLLLSEKYSLSELDLERSTQRAGTRYWYTRCRVDHRLMSFNEDLTIGEGRGGLEQMFFEKDDAIVLLDGEGEVTCELQRSGDLWVGRWQRFERMPIVLESTE